MPLWPGANRRTVPVSRIWVERPEDRFLRELAAGRSAREVERDRVRLKNLRERRAETARLRAEEAAEIEARAEAERWEAEQERRQAEDPRRYHFESIASLTAHRRDVEDYLNDAVVRARAEGIPWTVIGAALGVSKQAAQKRYR